MDSILTAPIVFILSLYLAFTNFLADGIISLLDPLENGPIVQVTAVDTDTDPDISTMPSHYEYGGSLPDILIKNAAYQKAAVIEGATTSTDPTASIADTIVNIYCQYRTDQFVRTTTGSGFFVNDNGVLLTNAHVAQFLLLEHIDGFGKTECVVRTGTEATAAYKVDLLYISPAWIQENADLISQAEPKGTGERDYALLYVTEGISNNPVPTRLPYLESFTELLSLKTKGEVVTIGGYPANKLYTDGPDATLTQELATTTVADLFTFTSQYADIFFLNGSRIGEHGVSGGPVVDEEGRAIGMISTRNNDEELGVGSLSAITLSYIHRTMLEETGFGFRESVSGNLQNRAKIFQATIVPFLSSMLEEEL